MQVLGFLPLKITTQEKNTNNITCSLRVITGHSHEIASVCEIILQPLNVQL